MERSTSVDWTSGIIALGLFIVGYVLLTLVATNPKVFKAVWLGVWFSDLRKVEEIANHPRYLYWLRVYRWVMLILVPAGVTVIFFLSYGHTGKHGR